MTSNNWATKTIFPVAYINACYGVLITMNEPSTTPNMQAYPVSNGVKYKDKTGFHGGAASGQFAWFSVGK